LNRIVAGAAVAAIALTAWAVFGQGAAVAIDGDTLDVAGRRVRLFAIDAPERGEPGAAEAAENLRRMIAGKTVTCQRIEIDRYDREVSLCSAGGVDLSLAQLSFGHAVAWCFYIRKNRPSMLATFQRAEAEAKRERRGIWSRPFRPWRNWQC
jgi:endonuclease YncB( thermonuclease family)